MIITSIIYGVDFEYLQMMIPKDILEVGGRMFYDFIYKGGTQLSQQNLDTVNKYLDTYINNFHIREFDEFFVNFSKNLGYNNKYCISILNDIFYRVYEYLTYKYNNHLPNIEVNIYDNKLVFLFEKELNTTIFINDIEEFFDNFFSKYSQFPDDNLNLKNFVLIGFKESRIGINNTLNIKYSFDIQLFDFLKNLEYDYNENKSFCKTEFKIIYNEMGNKKIRYYFRFLDNNFESFEILDLKNQVNEFLKNNYINLKEKYDFEVFRLFEGFDHVNRSFLMELNNVKNDIYLW